MFPREMVFVTTSTIFLSATMMVEIAAAATFSMACANAVNVLMRPKNNMKIPRSGLVKRRKCSMAFAIRPTKKADVISMDLIALFRQIVRLNYSATKFAMQKSTALNVTEIWGFAMVAGLAINIFVLKNQR